MKKLTLLLSAMLLACATNMWAADSWIKVSIDQLTPTDVFLIVDSTSGCAMSNDKAKTPTAVAIMKDGAVDISKVAANLKWNITGDATEGYVISPNGDSTKRLYCDNTNNGVMVGTPETVYNLFWDAEVNKLKQVAAIATDGTITTRWIGCYSKQDWRCYNTNNQSNIKATITRFYKLVLEQDPESIAISGTPDKTNYEEGETFDPTGLVVTGTYSEGDPKEITSGITWTITPEVLATTTEEVKVVATVGTISSTEYVVPVTVTKHVVTPGTYTIALNADLYGVSTGNNGTEQTVTTNDITITSGCASSASSKTNYATDHIRYYADSYLKLAVPAGYDITKIEFTAFDKTWNGSITVSVGTYNNSTKTWTGEANNVDFSFAEQNRVKTITVTYGVHKEVPSAIEGVVVETPAVKTIENGQLVIIRDGVKYNAMGVRLQ